MKFEEERRSSSGASALKPDSEQTLTDASILSPFIAQYVPRHFISLSKQAPTLHEGTIKPTIGSSSKMFQRKQ